MAKLQTTAGSAVAAQPARENSTDRQDTSSTRESGTPVNAEALLSETASAFGENPSEERIQLVAYQLWMDRGCPIGSPEIDWMEAERTCRNSQE